jgi:hypothetical protein
MSGKRWTPCRSSSTTASRRSRAPRIAGLALSLALLAAATPGSLAQAIELSVVPRSGTLEATVGFRWARTSELLDSLQRGLESRITVVTRLSEPRPPLLFFAGDRVLVERTVVRSAFWDFLDHAFVLEEGSRQRTYRDPARLVRAFFTVREHLALPGASSRRGLYVSARAQFEPVRLMPPLTLVGLAGAASIVSTPWVRRDLP